MPVGRGAGTIVECDRAVRCGKPRVGRIVSQGHARPIPRGARTTPRVAVEWAIVRPIMFGDFVTASSSDHCSDKIEVSPHGDCPLWVISGHVRRKSRCLLMAGNPQNYVSTKRDLMRPSRPLGSTFFSGALGGWFFVHIKLIQPATPDGLIIAFAADAGALSERQTGHDVAWIFNSRLR
jgi:hypothetical protein